MEVEITTMAEIDKKKSYTIDMREKTKRELVGLAKQFRLPQGDTITFLMDEFMRTQDRLLDATNNKEVMNLMVQQQKQLILLLQEQNSLLQRLVVDKDE